MLSFLILFINFVLQLKTDKDKSFGALHWRGPFGIYLLEAPNIICETFTFFSNQVVDTVHSLLDVAKDGATDVVNIKV